MAKCVTCGAALHPERAAKYDYCTAPDCQEKNARGLTIVAVGVNKAADQYEILDERTRANMASGKYNDQRRAPFDPSASGPPGSGPSASGPSAPGTRARPARRSGQPRRPAASPVNRPPWSRSQERLALLYNQQGMRPDEIARKLGLTTYTVTQLILAAKSRGKL